MTIEQLAELQRKACTNYDGFDSALMVCAGTGCVANNAVSLIDHLRSELDRRSLSDRFLVVPTGCNGFCAKGPIMVVQPEGTFYQKLLPEDLPEIIEKHLIGGTPVERLLHEVNGVPTPLMEDIPFFSSQKLLALRHKGLINPEEIDDYIRVGGYQTLHRVLTTMKPLDVISAVTRSGLRGRGGGGFPAGVKWNACADRVRETGNTPYVVCNADEGDPGAFMDRSIIEADPHCVLEGMMIGAYAIGASEGFVYIRKEYPIAMQRLTMAIAQARERGLMGKDILGAGFEFDVTVHRGAGAFVCGEETALMASMEGKPGEPTPKYVLTIEKGYRGMPTVNNNVETWVNVPLIMEKGPEWFATIGTGDVSIDPWNGSSGTKIFSLVGDVNNIGLVEVPMGISLREIIYDIGGGIPGGKAFKGVQTGGPSGGVLPAAELDLKVDFDTLTAAGSMMGSGGMVVMDEDTCMVQIARYFIDFLVDESCGKCTPCREGLIALGQILKRITEGSGKESDVGLLESYCTAMEQSCLCALGRTAPNPVMSTIRFFRDEYEAHIRDQKCPAGKCKDLISYSIIPENCTGCTICARQCPSDAITGEIKKPHEINDEKCIRCGICLDVCRFNAVEVN